MKRLTLHSEHLSDLSTDELASVAGGATVVCLTGVYPTIDRPCLSEDVCLVGGPIPTGNCFTGTTGSPTAFC